MAKRILVSKNRGDGNPKVFTLLNGSVSQVGADLPTTMEPNNNTSLARNRVIEFEGELYCAQNYNIYKYSEASGTWGLERGGSGIANAENHMDYGLYISLIDNVPTLYHIFQGSGTTGFTVSLNKKQSKFAGNGEWSEVANLVATDRIFFGDQDTTYPGLLDVLQVGNRIYFAVAYENILFGQDGFNKVNVFDMETETPSSVANPAPLSTSFWFCPPISFCEHNGRLFYMMYDAVDAAPERFDAVSLVEIIGSTSIKRDTILFNAGGVTQGTYWGAPTWFEGRHALFTDESNLYMLWHRADTVSDYGFRLQVYDAPKDSQDVTPIDDVETTVLPNIFTQSDGNLPNFRARWIPYTQITASGDSEIFLMHTPFGLDGSLGTIYKFNGSGSLLTTEGIGGDASFSMPSNRQGAGQYEWSEFKPFDSHIEDVRPSQIPGNMDVDFRITAGSGQAVRARLLYDIEGEHLNSIASLQMPSSGTITGGNTIINIVADSGILYTVSWQAQSDGVDVGQALTIVPQVTLDT